LIPSTIEETLRYRSPVQGIIRYTTRDLEMNSNNKVQVIPKGKRVIAHIGSANHDELIFPFAEKFDITRNPNPHIAFGAGIHLCIGAPLAKLEAVVALRTILKHINEIHLADPSKPLKSLDSLIIHGVEQLPISFKCTKN
jgi:cytochrome P450